MGLLAMPGGAPAAGQGSDTAAFVFLVGADTFGIERYTSSRQVLTGEVLLQGQPRISYLPRRDGRGFDVLAYNRLWTIGLDGGLPEPLPMPRAFTGVYSPDGRRIAYEEVSTAFLLTAQNQTSQWRYYRGGRTHPIRVMNLADYAVEKLPWT